MNAKLLFTLLIVLTASGASAAKRPNSTVEGLQMPAWEASALEIPLAGKDRIVAASGARALLRLANGGVIKLGQHGVFVLDELDHTQYQLKELVKASLDVLSGAFRFTAQAL